MTELESVDALRAYLTRGASLQSVVIQGVDLRAVEGALANAQVAGAVFLGCGLSPALTGDLVARGAVVFPDLPEIPYQPYRSQLYTPDELLAGTDPGDAQTFWTHSLDAKIYQHYLRARSGGKVAVLEALGQRLHDHAIDDALADLLAGEAEGSAGRRVVAVMGGHALRRTDASYLDVVRLAAGLTRAGYFVVSGGGPGAMEATHLGAWLADHADTVLHDAVAVLAEAPGYQDPGWLATALAVRDRFPGGRSSLGVPTWFYGHEPSSVFATHLAKYFSNSLREDGLLGIADHGVIYAPGSAGTVQEVFMDATQNHYATFGHVSPMVFLGVAQWTQRLPVLPLLKALAGDRAWGDRVLVTDAVRDVVPFLKAHPPVTPP